MTSTESMDVSELPLGENPPALQFPHFPTRQQAFIWRNWEMVPAERLAQVIGASEADVLQLAGDLGLPVPPQVSPHWLPSGYITIVRQNWHLLPYEQLLELLGWTAAQLDFALREDDFLWVKVGLLKPDSEPIRYAPLTAEEQAQTAKLKDIVQRHFGDKPERATVPFEFLDALQAPEIPERLTAAESADNEVTLDASWTLVTPQGDLGLAKLGTETALKGFVTVHGARWGIQLNQSAKADGPRIELVIDSSEKLPRESHAIEIAADRIVISAIDATGWRRGLQWLEDTMLQRGGPHLPVGRITRNTRFDLRLSYPYCGIYGDALIDPESDPFPDGLLARLSKLGVNGLWLQGLFTSLYPWDLAPEMSIGWENRLANLGRLADRAAAYGIGLYLYTNEPRGLAEAAFEKYPALQPFKGVLHPTLGQAAVCTSHPATIDFLRNSTAHIFKHVPQLAGLFTITLSENPTSCFSHGIQEQCPRCKERTLTDAIAEVNNVIAEGAWSSQPAARVIAYTWGTGWPVDSIDIMPGIEIMTVSEEHMPTEIAGVKGNVIDYTMGQIGPGPKALETWQRGKEHGNPTIAKMQINNTWECSAVPYIPVPDLVEEHLDRVERAGVTGLMLGWTLGGYPAGNLELAAQHFWDDSSEWASGQQVAKRAAGEAVDLNAYAEKRFGAAAAPAVRSAWRNFSEAFVEYPFSLSTLYVAPYNYGPMNVLHAKPTGYSATMIGFPYDDLVNWSNIYPADIYENQARLLSEIWAQGLEQLKQARPAQEAALANGDVLPIGAEAALTELEAVANASYLHFRSSYLQAGFVRTRDALAAAPEAEQAELRAEMGRILDEEIELAKQLYDIAAADSRIGYEASNHYYYALHDFQEKVVNCEYMREYFGV